jgi:hypothetical protein
MGMLTTVSSRPLSSLISFRGNVLDEPELCRTVHGKWVPYPKGRDGKLGAFPVVEYGERAVTYGLEPPGTDTDDATRLYNNATRHYLARRPGLLKEFLGKWVAFGSGGQMFMADTEKEVRSVAEMLFPINQDEYYADCIGKEIICGVYMDCTSSVKVRPALVNNQFLVDAEYFNGKSFEPVSTKHDTGASMLGVPLEVLSSMKDSSLVRARNVIAHGPFHSSKSRIYHNFRVRINGLETRTTAIQARDWLLGYPVLIRYLNTINADSSQKLTLTPLPGREDTDDCNLQDV